MMGSRGSSLFERLAAVSGSRETPDDADVFRKEVTARFGMLPNFFCSAQAVPGLTGELWVFAKSAYLDSPLPSLFKERLFVHLSRFCEVRYCIVRHVGFLLGQGLAAGDSNATPLTVDQVMRLLRRPLPDAQTLEHSLQALAASQSPSELPEPETEAEVQPFDALTIPFLARAQALAETVRERHPSLPVVFITGYAGGETLTGGDVVTKPFETAALARLVEEKLKWGSTLDESRDLRDISSVPAALNL
jgi:hypothetical protein